MPCLLPTLALISAMLLGGCAALEEKTGISILGLPKPVRVTQDDSGRDVELAHAQRMIVRLPRDPKMSGYQWTLREPSTLAVMAEGAPEYGATEEVWSFTPVRPGLETLRLEYRQPRAALGPAAKSVSYNVAVP